MSASGTFYLIVAALTYGLLQVIDKVALRHGIDPGMYTVLRVTFAAGFISFYSKLEGETIVSIFKKQYIISLLIIGILTSGIGLFFQIKGLSYSSVTNVSMLLTLVAPATSIAAIIYLRENITAYFIISLIMMVCGVWCIYFKNNYTHFGKGDTLILLAIISFACGNVYIRKTITRDVPTSMVTLGRLVFGALSLALLLPLMGASLKNLGQSLPFVVLGGVVFGIRMAAYHKGIAAVGASKAATFLLLSPVVAVIVAHFILAEPLTGQIIIGIILVLAGALFLLKSPKPASMPKSS